MNNNIQEMKPSLIQVEEAQSAATDAITLMSVFLSILKRPWILIVSLIVVLAPLFFYLSNISTSYQSSSTVMVSVSGSSFLDAVSLVEGRRNDVKSEKYYTSILDSRAYRDDIAQTILSSNPHMLHDSVSYFVKNNIGYQTNRREPGFIVVFASSQSKEFAYELAQTALVKFKERSINLQREDAIHISDFINNQIESISVKLEKAEEELQSFLSRKNLILDPESGITQELFDLERKHNEAKASFEMVNINIASYDKQMSDILSKLTDESSEVDEDRIFELKNRLTEIRKLFANAQSIGLSQSDIQLLMAERDELRNELIGMVTPLATSENSEFSNVGVTIQRLEEELEAALLTQTESRNQVQFYQLQIKRFRNDHPNLSEDILTYASLTRAKIVLQKTTDILLEKREEIRIRVESEMGGVKVIDAPRIPDLPMPRKRMRKLVFGVLVAFGMGITLSVIRDRFDTSIKDDDDITRLFGLPVFGTIPSLDGDKRIKKLVAESFEGDENIDNSSGRGERSKNLLKHFKEKSPIAEAYRSARINLQFLATDRSKKVFVISSPSVSEGKSMTSANMAVSFARGGSKVVVLDCDLRKTTQHKYFEVDRKPGLTDYFLADANLEDIKRDVGISNLTLIPGGKSPNNPAGLLASQKMKQLIKHLREDYDYILIDTPPILVCSDGVIMIARVESTSGKALDYASNLTKHLNIEVLGVILNQVAFRFGWAYYYTYRYYRPYSYYSGYYYKREYYDYTETETGERIKVPRKGKKTKKRKEHSEQA